MLSEWLTSLITDCPPDARRLGYLRESIGIRSRYRRCMTSWQPHLKNSRTALLESLHQCSHFRTALIFGSGLLLDIPLNELAQRFERVILVDIVHLPEVRRAVRLHANVECISHDVSGFMQHMYELRPGELDLPPPQNFLDDRTIDWVASVNLVSQLPLLPQDWLRQRFPELDGAMLEQWGTRLMLQHLDYLASFSAQVILLTDLKQIIYDYSGERLQQFDCSARLGLENLIVNEWRWDIAPAGEIAPGIGSFHHVGRCNLMTN